MPQRVLANLYALGPHVLSGSLLNEALDASETAVDVDAGTDFLIGDVAKVEDEEMDVTNVVGNTLTVTRGVNGTTATTHADDTPVYVRPSGKLTVADTAVGFPAGRVFNGVAAAHCSLETGNILYRTGGAKPTSSNGHLLRAPCKFVIRGNIDVRTIEFIREGATSGVVMYDLEIEA